MSNRNVSAVTAYSNNSPERVLGLYSNAVRQIRYLPQLSSNIVRSYTTFNVVDAMNPSSILIRQ